MSATVHRRVAFTVFALCGIAATFLLIRAEQTREEVRDTRERVIRVERTVKMIDPCAKPRSLTCQRRVALVLGELRRRGMLDSLRGPRGSKGTAGLPGAAATPRRVRPTRAPPRPALRLPRLTRPPRSTPPSLPPLKRPVSPNPRPRPLPAPGEPDAVDQIEERLDALVEQLRGLPVLGPLLDPLLPER